MHEDSDEYNEEAGVEVEVEEANGMSKF